MHYHGGTTIHSFASHNGQDHNFEIQREKCTHGVFKPVFSWNRHFKSRLGRVGPLRRDCVTLDKMMAIRPEAMPSKRLSIYRPIAHAATESRAWKSWNEEFSCPKPGDLSPLHPFAPTFGFHHALAPWRTPWWGHRGAVRVSISQTQHREPFTYHLLCPEEDKGSENQKTHIPAKGAKKRTKIRHGGECCPDPT